MVAEARSLFRTPRAFSCMYLYQFSSREGKSCAPPVGGT